VKSNVELGNKILKPCGHYRFCGDVSKMVFARNKYDLKCLVSYLITYKMEVNFYMLDESMKHRIDREVGCTNIITP
jgi:hypothetical protein